MAAEYQFKLLASEQKKRKGPKEDAAGDPEGAKSKEPPAKRPRGSKTKPKADEK